LICSAVAIFASVGLFYWCTHPLAIYPDQALYLHMAKLFIQGKVPYVDMFDNNPPLAFYVQMPPIALAHALHIPEPLAFALYIWALILLASTAAGIMLCRSGSRGALYCGLITILGFVYFNQGEVLDFGQREHIFTVLYFPFLILRYLRWQNLKVDRPLAIFVGVMAGIGIALKHYFLLVALAPEIVFCLERRSLRPFFQVESLALALTISLYLLHFLFLPQAELASFFGFIVPIYKAGYQYYTTSLAYNLNTFWREHFYFMALTTLGAIVLARRSALVMPIQAFSLMSALIFILAGQIWSYHVLPVRLASCMSITLQAFLLVDYLPIVIKSKKYIPLVLALCLLGASSAEGLRHYNEIIFDRDHQEEFFMPALGYSGVSPSLDVDPFTTVVVNHSRSDDSLLFISSSMSPGYPVFIQTGRRPASRFLHAMILPVLQFVIDNPGDADRRERKRFEDQMQQILTWYGEDIATNKPKLIFVQIPFMSPFLEQRQFFKKQMADYRLLESKEDNRIYVRQDQKRKG
jgi:hypothetical protein